MKIILKDLMKKHLLFCVYSLIAILTLVSCNGQAVSTSIPNITNTPDLCGPDVLPAEVEKVHKHMREFDDASMIATNVPLDKLSEIIADMQRIRRGAEDQIVPACLSDLKRIQLVHMNTVIETLVAFLGGADPEMLRQGILLSRQQHNQYAIEYARLLGLTVVVLPTETPIAGASVTDTPQPPANVVYLAMNSGAADIPLYAEPSESSAVIAVLVPGGSIKILSQSQDGVWLSVEIPGQTSQIAWVLASKVTVAQAP